MEAAAAACAKLASGASGHTYARREPEKTALFQVVQNHLLTFEQEWTDKSDGRTLPSFVTDELHDFLGCGILARRLAQLSRPTCHQRYVASSPCSPPISPRWPRPSRAVPPTSPRRTCRRACAAAS